MIRHIASVALAVLAVAACGQIGTVGVIPDDDAGIPTVTPEASVPADGDIADAAEASCEATCPAGDGRSCALDGRCHVTSMLSGGYGDAVQTILAGKTTIAALTDEHSLSGTTHFVQQIAKNDGSVRQGRAFGVGIYPAVLSFGVDPESDDLAIATTDALMSSPPHVLFCPDGACSAASPLLDNQATTALTIRGDYIYFIDAPSGELRRCAKAGCANAPEVVAPAPAGVVDGAKSWITTDATSVFVIYGNGLVGRAPIGVGGAVTTLATSTGAYGPSLDDDTLYFASPAGAFACAKGGCAGAPRLVAASALGVVSDGTRIYYSVGGGGSDTIQSVPKAGGPAVPLISVATPGDTPGGFPIAVDTSYVYFGTGGVGSSTGSLSRIDK